ncbi:MAG TPA: ABC transporter permease [Vicinamibacterales bacterium]|nr:ABC transporter permease [Vicinamibacterales bacterium]
MSLRPTTLTLVLVIALASCGPGQSDTRDYPAPPAGSYDTATMQLTALGESRSVTGAGVSAEFFPAARVQPMLGRLFVPEEFTQVGTPVVILHHDLWQKVFGGSPQIIGRTVSIDGRPRTIVGIMPVGFSLPKGAELWIPK